VQYACEAFQQRLWALQMRCSMSRRGNCYDNAVTESFFGTLKQELIYRNQFATRQEARAAIFQYIEIFYNRTRMHSTLDYRSPEAYEAIHSWTRPRPPSVGKVILCSLCSPLFKPARPFCGLCALGG
jgi:transposase InsO family protein